MHADDDGGENGAAARPISGTAKIRHRPICEGNRINSRLSGLAVPFGADSRSAQRAAYTERLTYIRKLPCFALSRRLRYGSRIPCRRRAERTLRAFRSFPLY